MWRHRLIAVAVLIAYRLLAATWRKIEIEHPSVTRARAQGRTCVYAHWHGDELAILYLVRKLHIATMTSVSRDGRLMDVVLRSLGGATSHGSSTRGGASGLRGLVRLCRKGRNASMAVDGPRGPRHRVKPGVFQLARLTRGVVVPMGVAASARRVSERSWNKAQLPLPFARVAIYFGPASPVLTREDELDSDRRCEDLARRLHAAGERAQAALADRG